MKTARLVFRLLCVLILALACLEVFGMRGFIRADETTHENKQENEDVDAHALEEKKQTLEQKERQIAEQEQKVKLQEKELEKKLKEMERLRAEISGELEKQRQNNEERVAKMVVVFETMTPKAAAGVLETLDDWLSVEILKRMDSKRMAKVMNIMDKSRSAKLSELLTGYHKPEDRKISATGQATGKPQANVASAPKVDGAVNNAQQKGGK